MLGFAEELQCVPSHPEAFLVTEHGHPFKSSGALDNRIRKWVLAAELTKTITGADGKPEKKAARSQHGLRKATAHELARAGATAYEIAARLSHSDFKSSAPYVRDVELAHLSESGFDRVQRSAKINSVPRTHDRGTPGVPGAMY